MLTKFTNMNKKVTIPPNWRPGNNAALNRWFSKIHREARKQKGLTKIKTYVSQHNT